MALSEAQREALTAWLACEIGAGRVRLDGCTKLAGGAIQENLALDLVVEGGPRAGRHALVLRTDSLSGVAESHTRAEEFQILTVVHRAGLRVPEPWAVDSGGAVLGKPFFLMSRAAGEARGNRLVRDQAVAAAGEAIAATLGSELAKLHRLRPPLPELAFISIPDGPVLPSRIAELRSGFDLLDEPQPVFEWGLRWLERHAQPGNAPTLVHADCRTGNYLVDDGKVTAILDWEFARFSDPLEDLGWLLARCWRCGVYHRHCGGIGTREALLGAYEAATGRAIDRISVQHWELFGTIRWGLIALQQAERHFSGGEPSLELALTGHVVPVLERDVLAYVEAIERGNTI